MSMEQQFRSAAIGGFNRQDVLTYIETSARAHAQEMEALRQELDQAKRDLEDARARAVSAETERDDLAPRAAQMEKSTAELESKRSGLAAAERELKELRARVAMLEPKAEAYEAVKDKTAGIELEAHQRARKVVEEAQKEADALRAQTEQWLAKVRGSYERMRTDVEAAITHAASELERAGKAVSGVGSQFREHDAAMQALVGTVKNRPANK